MKRGAHWVGIREARPANLFEQALEKGWVLIVSHGKGYKASFSWDSLTFTGVGPSTRTALKALAFHVGESDAGEVRP